MAKDRQPDNFDRYVQQVVDNSLKEVHTCLPGSIVSFDSSTQIASIQPLLKRKFVNDQEVDLPLCINCPVIFPGAGGFVMTFPVEPGDECLIVFSERALDTWIQSGGAQLPLDTRRHSLSDAIAILGLKSQPNKLPAVFASGIELKDVAGNTFCRVKSDGVDIKGNTLVTGDLTVDGDTDITGTLDVIGIATADDHFSGIVSGETHTHSGVTPGAGVSGPPIGGGGGPPVVLSVVDGGTGSSTQQDAINELTQVSGATDEYVLTKDTASGDALWKVATGGGGVTNPLGEDLDMAGFDLIGVDSIRSIADTDTHIDMNNAANSIVVNPGVDAAITFWSGAANIMPAIYPHADNRGSFGSAGLRWEEYWGRFLNIEQTATIATLAATSIGAFQATGAIDFNNQNMTNVDIDSGTINGITDLAIADGGTGQGTAQAAIDALTAVSGATNEHVLTKDTGTGNALWKAATIGDVTAAAALTDNAIVRGGAAAKAVQTSGISISDTDDITGVEDLVAVHIETGSINIASDLGVLITPGSDIDTILINLDVTDNPQILWDESPGSWVFSEGNVHILSTTKGLALTDSAGGIRYGIKYGAATQIGHATPNIMALTNRADDGVVQIQAHDGTGVGGATGEVAVATFADTLVTFHQDVKFEGDVGFYNTAPQSKPTITGSRGGNVALADLLTELAILGLIIDSST